MRMFTRHKPTYSSARAERKALALRVSASQHRRVASLKMTAEVDFAKQKTEVLL